MMPLEQRRKPSSSGYALLDALAAMLIFSIVATSIIAVIHDASRHFALAVDYDRARIAAETALADLEAVSWHRLQEIFAIAEEDSTARIRSGDGSAPDSWDRLVAGLEEGVLEVRLEALGAAGVSVPFAEASALRVRVEVEFAATDKRRNVRLTHVRF